MAHKKTRRNIQLTQHVRMCHASCVKGGGGEGEGKITSCLKLVIIMLENSNLVHKYTQLCSFIKYTFPYQRHLNFADVSIFFAKHHRFLAKIVPLPKALL